MTKTRVFIGIAFCCLGSAAWGGSIQEFEFRSTKGCKLIDYEVKVAPNKRKLEKIEWNAGCKGGYAEGDGSAIFYYSDGRKDTVSASFHKGRAEGWGTLEQKSEKIEVSFRGDFAHGKPNGTGVMTISRSDSKPILYRGAFVDGLPEGHGTMEFPNRTYIGQFREGRPSGAGRFEFPNKAVYEGEVRNGMMNGRGKLLFPNGATFSGYFVDDGSPKVGQVEFPNGAQYEGEVEKGLPSGIGKLIFPDKATYYGQFKQGKPNGDGVLMHPDGKRQKVVAEDGKFTKRFDIEEQDAIARAQARQEQANSSQQAQNDALEAAIWACKAKVYSIPAASAFESMSNASLCDSNPNAWMGIQPVARPAPQQQKNTNCRWIGSTWSCSSY